MNTVILIGRISTDPELRYLPESGVAKTNFSIAINSKNKKKENIVNFFRVETWGKLAESTSKNLEKGRLISLRGSLKNEEWTDESGVKRSVTKITASNIEYLDYKKSNDTNKDPFTVNPYFQAIDNDDIPF